MLQIQVLGKVVTPSSFLLRRCARSMIFWTSWGRGLTGRPQNPGSGKGRYALIVPVLKMRKIYDFWDFLGGRHESLKIQVLGEVAAPS